MRSLHRRSPPGATERLLERMEQALDDIDAAADTTGDEAGLYRDALLSLRRTSAILDGVGDGVFACDGIGEITEWNRAAERLLDRPARRAIGRGCSQVMRLTHGGQPLDCSRGCALLALLRDGTSEGNVEVVRRRTGSRDQELLIGIKVIENAAHQVEEIVHTARDIGAIKHADEAKSMFLATASHELKTPLTVILGYTQALRDGWMGAESHADALASIDARAKQLSGIVDRMLMTGRIEGGKIELNLRTVELPDLVRERIDSFAGASARTIAYEIEEDVSEVMADEDALATALDHLIDNAIKYSPKGGDIRVAVFERAGRVVTEIADPGIGMTADEAAHCFERFWQAESTDVRRFGGTGIGLYIVRSLIEGMGGRVAVQSALGNGTTFSVTLERSKDGRARKKADEEPGVGRPTMIEEFMRQIGVPQSRGGGS